jgi:hypothetical protein
MTTPNADNTRGIINAILCFLVFWFFDLLSDSALLLPLRRFDMASHACFNSQSTAVQSMPQISEDAAQALAKGLTGQIFPTLVVLDERLAKFE